MKAGRPYTDCLPSRKGHCCNVALSPAPAMTSSMTTADNGHGLSLALTGDTHGSTGNDVLYSQDTPCLTSSGRDANALKCKPSAEILIGTFGLETPCMHMY